MQHPKTNRRKTIGLTAALLCVVFVLNAQTVWNKTYTGGRPTMVFGSVFFDDTCYKVTGLAKGNIYNSAKAIIGNIDLNGSLTNYKLLNDSIPAIGTIWENVLIKTSEGKFAFTGYYIDSLLYVYFGIANGKLDTISTFKYHSPNVLSFKGNAMLQKNGSYYIAGVKTDSLQNDPNVFLMKIDAVGNRVFERRYGAPSRYEVAQSIIALPNDHLLIGAVKMDVDASVQTAQTWLLEVDTTGTLIRQWLDPNDSTYDAYGLKQTADGGFIYGTKKKVEERPLDPLSEGLIVKLNSNFQKEWTYTENRGSTYTSFYDVEQTPTGDFIATGKYSYSFGWVMKLSTWGDVVWNKKYSPTTDTNGFSTLIDVDVLPDGSIIAVGEYQGNGNGPVQAGWFLKLDSNGCEIENCLVGIEGDIRQQTIEDRQIQIQPNPANGNVQLTIENEMIGGTISLYNLTGELELQQTATGATNQLNIAALSKGLYIVTVQKQGQLARARLVVE